MKFFNSNINVSRVVKDKKFIQNSISIYGVNFANIIFPLITIPYLTRQLGIEGWGELAYFQALAFYATLMIKSGSRTFVFKGAASFYSASNVILIGIFAPMQYVGYYASADKLTKALRGLINPKRTTP
jgi:O-antigen/teichoic acid export membrane protein